MTTSKLALFLLVTAYSSDMLVSAFSTVTPTAPTGVNARKISSSSLSAAKAGQAEVVLVGCGAPNRGMGWYHAVQMLEGR